jgi:hypothetical protein
MDPTLPRWHQVGTTCFLLSTLEFQVMAFGSRLGRFKGRCNSMSRCKGRCNSMGRCKGRCNSMGRCKGRCNSMGRCNGMGR